MTLGSAQLWDAYSGSVHAFIRRRVTDPHSADDLLQDVFLRVHAGIATLAHPEHAEAWIYQIARNILVDYYRAHRPLLELPETLAVTDNLDDNDAVRALAPCVRAMVDQLPPADREALAFTAYAGGSQRALSAQLGISVSGAKSRVQRARAKLRAQLVACCAFEFDSAGRIIDFAPHRACALDPCDSCCN